MSIFVDRGKLENPEKISSEQGREPTTLKRKALLTLGPGLTDHSQNTLGNTSLSRRHLPVNEQPVVGRVYNAGWEILVQSML